MRFFKLRPVCTRRPIDVVGSTCLCKRDATQLGLTLAFYPCFIHIETNYEIF